MLSRRSARAGTKPGLEHGRRDGIYPAWAVDAAAAGVTGVERFSLCLGQLLELLGEEPPVCFRRCEVGGTRESGLRGVSSS
jgi:hypothetical protein